MGVGCFVIWRGELPWMDISRSGMECPCEAVSGVKRAVGSPGKMSLMLGRGTGGRDIWRGRVGVREEMGLGGGGIYISGCEGGGLLQRDYEHGN